MNPSEEFLRHAADCQQMAKFTRDPTSKQTWSRMAERWVRCAEVFKSATTPQGGRRVPALPASGVEFARPSSLRKQGPMTTGLRSGVPAFAGTHITC